MIPSNLLHTAKAQYLCNVFAFIGLGEGKELTPLEVCRIKNDYQHVMQWFEKLDTIAQLRVMRYLREQYEMSIRPLSSHH